MWNVDVNNLVVSKLVEKKNNSTVFDWTFI